jgi:hypothetical protein
MTLALSTVVQRYALATPEEEFGVVLNKLGRDITFWIGMALYLIGNGFYTVGLLTTPLALASSLVMTLLFWNTIIAYYITGCPITKYDIAGDTIILAAVSLIAVFGPQPSEEDSLANIKPENMTANLGRVAGIAFFTVLFFGLILGILCVRSFERQFPHFGEPEDKQEIHDHVTKQFSNNDLDRGRSPTVAHIFPSIERVKIMQVVYPAVLGTFESLVQISLKCSVSFATYWWEDMTHPMVFVMIFVLIFASVMTVQWLKKVYSHFETTDCLGIEYGCVTTISVIAGLTYFDEAQYCTRISVMVDILLIVAAILLIGLGCYVLCFLKPTVHDELLTELLAHPDNANRPHNEVRHSIYNALRDSHMGMGSNLGVGASTESGMQGTIRDSEESAGLSRAKDRSQALSGARARSSIARQSRASIPTGAQAFFRPSLATGHIARGISRGQPVRGPALSRGMSGRSTMQSYDSSGMSQSSNRSVVSNVDDEVIKDSMAQMHAAGVPSIRMWRIHASMRKLQSASALIGSKVRALSSSNSKRTVSNPLGMELGMGAMKGGMVNDVIEEGDECEAMSEKSSMASMRASADPRENGRADTTAKDTTANSSDQAQSGSVGSKADTEDSFADRGLSESSVTAV